jgi:hypothetical protein
MIEIVKWSNAFESADTRKRQRLGWFLCPSGCDSKGFRQLMRMGNDGLIALGFFQALCQSMATQSIESRRAGIFKNSDNSTMDFTDVLEVSRLNGMEPADSRQIIGRLVSVGWLRICNPLETQQSAANLPPVCHPSPGFVQGEGEGEGQEEEKGEDVPLAILPHGWKKLTGAERKRKKVNFNNPIMIRIGKFFGQRETTLWTIEEYSALQDVDPPEEDVDLIEEHYSYVIDRNGYRFTTISTLLNNWSAARAKANAYFDENPSLRAS